MVDNSHFFCLMQFLYILFFVCFYIYIHIFINSEAETVALFHIYVPFKSCFLLYASSHILQKKAGHLQALFYSLWTVTHFGIPREISPRYTHMHRTTKNIKQTVMTSITKFSMNSCKPLLWFTHQHQCHSTTKRHM